jgi:hypothetical protein
MMNNNSDLCIEVPQGERQDVVSAPSSAVPEFGLPSGALNFGHQHTVDSLPILA